MSTKTYLTRRHRPHLKVIRPHENIRNPRPHIADIPLIEIPRLGTVGTSLQRSVNQRVNAPHLLLLREHGDVILERVRDPPPLVADIRDSLVRIPVGFLGEGFVQTVVEVLVVREDDVAADVEELN